MQELMDKPWLAQNIKTGHGPLCAAYPQDYTSEGDTPSFLPLVNNGLEQDKNYTWGGWGGRPVYSFGNHMQDGSDDHNGKPDSHYAFQRWLTAAQNDFAARADWCVKSCEEANPPPAVRVTNPINLQARPKAKVKLSAKGTRDPDGNQLTYKWWQYAEADTYAGTVAIQHADRKEASFIMPETIGNGQTIHIICEVTDNGTPSLTRYQRVIIKAMPNAK
ncbi:nucleoside hydrolase-like domain-containing protein [Paraflavisolibacter sp. H34]|uniref:nucleoside hydrolase-like domain-containing protein n=1 Tax=Huijunlia imazamoxiresistens TaxID=3127457 RepID=UPI0030177519